MSDTNKAEKPQKPGSADPAPQGVPADTGQKHPVDVEVQEDAAKDRVEGGGYS